MDKKPLYYIIFKDKTKFIGGISLKESKWTNIPNKQIERLYYLLPTGDFLCFSGYEKYYHMVEATMDLMGPSKGIENIEYIYIMGKKKDKVISYRITLLNRKGARYKVGDITVREFNINEDKIKKLNPIGWK